jgi:hypothetical protein
MPENFSTPLQENLVTVLAYNAEQGRVLANTLNTGLMDPDFRTIADACVAYWKEYDKPPLDHTADLLSHITEDKGHRRSKAVTRILRGMVALSDSINTEYVVRQTQDFEFTQAIKAAIIDSAEKVNSLGHNAIEDVREIWGELLSRGRSAAFDPGTRLSNFKAVLDHLRQSDAEFSSGIPLLDRRHITPARGTLFMWLGASGRGKTWALVMQGGEALRRRKKVLHITCEMDEAPCALRYYQFLFGCSKRDVPVNATALDLSEGKLVGLDPKIIKPAFALDQESLAPMHLKAHITRFGKRFDNLIIKNFPSGDLSINGLVAFLDMLEASENFIPDLLILDYAGIMKIDPRAPRESHSQNVISLRGLMQKRNMAGATAWQSNREGADSHVIKATNVAEAWPIIHHSDIVVSFSSSDREFLLGLCRGFVPKARNEEDKFSFLMTQSYKVGQFCMESHYLSADYYEHLDALAEPEGADADAA